MDANSDETAHLQRLRDAASRFATFDEEDEFDIEVAGRLIGAFGGCRVDPMAHRRAAWLCVLASRRILYGWSALGCEGTAPFDALRAAADWVATGAHGPDFARHCLPAEAIIDGHRVVDCDACRVEPIASASARTASFTKTAQPIDGAIVLCDVRGAVLEGLEHPDGVDFGDWLINRGVPDAFGLVGVGEDRDE